MTRTQPPEGLLIEEARESRRRGLSQNRAAELAGMSGTRWRHIVNGTRPVSGPKVTETIARMALVVGVTPEEMAHVGREDVAAIMAELQTHDGRTGRADAPLPEESAGGERAEEGTGRMKGWPLHPNEELSWEPQDPNLPGPQGVQYVYRWSNPDDANEYIESSKAFAPERDPIEVAQLFREMLTRVHGEKILKNPEHTRRG